MPDEQDKQPDPGTAHQTITVVGLGPGDWSQLTLGALDALLAAPRIIFRTRVHPTVQPLLARLRPEQHVSSFDERYERATSFDVLYEEIVDALLAAAKSGGSLIYAVPGHPLVGERSVKRLLAVAPQRGVNVQVVDGLSFLEPVLRVLGLDPLDEALQILDGAHLVDHEDAAFGERWRGPSSRVLRTDRPLLLGQVYDRRVASHCKLWLLERYPADARVAVVSAAGTSEARARTVELAQLDHSIAFDHLTSIFVPPLEPLRDLRGLATLPYIAARLRAPDGCPWDREQTLASLKGHLLEEAHEAAAALDGEDPDAIAEELGDVLLLVTMLSQIGDEAELFDLPQVMEAVNTKLIRRHPHIFGEVQLADADAVRQHWERVKGRERHAAASALDGVPISMPALLAAGTISRKVAALGFDWRDADEVWGKVREEIAEVQEAATPEHRLEEMGDLLFAMVTLGRHLGVDAEEALRRANAKFRERFMRVEDVARERGLDLASMDSAELDTLWQEAKALLHAGANGA